MSAYLASGLPLWFTCYVHHDPSAGFRLVTGNGNVHNFESAVTTVALLMSSPVQQ